MKKPNFLSKYFSPVASTIDVNRPLKTTNFETKLIDCTNFSKPIDTGGIEVGKCEKVGTHLGSFNETLNKIENNLLYL